VIDPCGGCLPFVPCPSFTPTASYSESDQDDTHSWIVQKHYSPPATNYILGFASVGSLTHPIDWDQIGSPPEGVLTRLFYSVPIPAGSIEARLSGQVWSTLLHGPGLTGVGWEIVRAGWGDAAPGGIDPGGTVLASGTIDFLAASPQVTAVDFDTGRVAVGGGDFQFYLRFVTPPERALGDYQLHLQNHSYTFDGVPYTYAWALEFFDCSTMPKANQPVQSELIGYGDGVMTAFTTDFPYRAFSLAVSVAGMLSDVDPSGPSTGAFILADAPPSGAPIYASYRAAGA
jgi:hypothetical protein